jgi:hypothetical protein
MRVKIARMSTGLDDGLEGEGDGVSKDNCGFYMEGGAIL